MNVMKTIQIEKITLNFGAGKDQKKLEKGLKLLKHLTGLDPVKTTTKKRIPTWGLRPGLPIGCKITIRDQKKAKDLIGRFLKAKESTLKKSQFDKGGNIAFGIHEYIDIPDVEYTPDVGIMGFETCITLKRAGFRIKKRKIQKRKVGQKHKITQNDAIEFMKKEFGVKVEE